MKNLYSRPIIVYLPNCMFCVAINEFQTFFQWLSTQEYALHMDDTSITYAKILNNVGTSMVNGGYAGGRIARVKPLTLDCGITDFKAMLNANEIFFKLKETDDFYIRQALSQGRHPLEDMPADLMPEALTFTYENFFSMMKSALACLLGDKESQNLNLELKLLFDLLQQRLMARNRFFKAINQDFEAMLV